jgi:hypothetical protein
MSKPVILVGDVGKDPGPRLIELARRAWFGPTALLEESYWEWDRYVAAPGLGANTGQVGTAASLTRERASTTRWLRWSCSRHIGSPYTSGDPALPFHWGLCNTRYVALTLDVNWA